MKHVQVKGLLWHRDGFLCKKLWAKRHGIKVRKIIIPKIRPAHYANDSLVKYVRYCLYFELT